MKEPALVRLWYRRKLHPVLWPLLPLTALFIMLSAVRRLGYWLMQWRQTEAGLPVLVVGNLTVGGTGKTPTVLALIELLQAEGWRPGIISRGYGGSGPFPRQVQPDSAASEVGDEPLLLAQLSGVPVAVAPKRKAAARLLAAETDCNIIIADDGLQHYSLVRTAEIALVDGQRGLGNGFRLPAGPLREGRRRLHRTRWVLVNQPSEHTRSFLAPDHAHAITMDAAGWFRVANDEPILVPDGETAIAVAGIGNPQRFFDLLREEGIQLSETQVFPDHYVYQARDFYQISNLYPIIMTEKDAVKCRDFARPHWYYLKIKASLPEAFTTDLRQWLRELQQA